MTKRNFARGHSTYICQVCHKETRDTNGEEDAGLCLLCYQLNEWENLHSDEDHGIDFEHCEECQYQMTKEEINHVAYYIGGKSYPTI